MRRRVVITGVGCVTPLGTEVETIWRRLMEGRSGIGHLTLFDASNYPVRMAAEVRDWDISEIGEDPHRWQHHPRQTSFTIGSAVKAVRDAGLDRTKPDPIRFGIYLGCGETFQDFFQFTELISGSLDGIEFQQDTFTADALRIWNPEAEQALELNMPASYLAAIFEAYGPNTNCIAACASSSQAIGEAAEVIRRGDADVMLAGGAHSMIHPFGITGFHRLSALSTANDDPPRAVRPFDRERDGFVVGEGGAVVVLESLHHAERRGAHIWAELNGYGSAQDAYRITDTHPEGRGAVSCMKRALENAQLNLDEVHYINAHGTSTPINDRMETLAIKRVFGPRAYRIPISSTKSMMGHFTTAGGAIELVVCLLAIRHGVAPPTINYETPDPECDLDYVPNSARPIPCQHALSNSFGFGGQNAALVVSRFEDRSTEFVRRRMAA